MTDLKPCPFCGGEAKARKGLDWYVQCAECSAELGSNCDYDGNQDGEYATEAEAIEAWNTRHSETCENANKNGYGFRFECSKCGYGSITTNCRTRNDELPRFCPNCGEAAGA